MALYILYKDLIFCCLRRAGCVSIAEGLFLSTEILLYFRFPGQMIQLRCLFSGE